MLKNKNKPETKYAFYMIPLIINFLSKENQTCRFRDVKKCLLR